MHSNILLHALYNSAHTVDRGLYSSNKLNCFPHYFIWDEYPSTISILPYAWNNDVSGDKKGFWCIKITNQIISLLKGYNNLVKEHSFLHLRLHVRPFMNIHPHQIRIFEFLSNQNPLLIWKNIAPGTNRCLFGKVFGINWLQLFPLMLMWWRLKSDIKLQISLVNL